MDSCIFCKIVSGKIPSHKVWEDRSHLAFLDIFPIKEGHTMVIPKKHSSYYFGMEEPDFQNLNLAAKKVAKILKQAFQPKTGKIGSIVYGLDMDHTHIHLVPIDKAGDLSFTNKHEASKVELEKALEKVKSA